MMLKIHTDHNSSQAVRFAGEELMSYLARIGGWVCSPATSADSADIILCLAGDALPFQVTRLTGAVHDAVGIVPFEDRLYFVGSNERSVLFAVYEYLSQLGVSWFAPGEEFIPRRKSWRIFTKPHYAEAALKYRGHLIDSANKSLNAGNLIPYIDWLVKNRANYLLFSVHFWQQFSDVALPELEKRETILELGHHGFDFFVSVDRYFGSRPEWFSLVNGARCKGSRDGFLFGGTQLCVSNAGALNAYIEAFLAYVRQNPFAKIFGVIPNDGHCWCECPECRKIEGEMPPNPIFPRRRQAGTQYLYVVRKVAERMRREFPDKLVAFWAYAGTLEPPLNPDLPPNTILSSFAGVNRCYEHSLFDANCDGEVAHSNKKHVDTLTRWRERYPGDIIVYEYYTKYIWLSLPKLMPEVINREITRLAQDCYGGVITFAEPANWKVYEINLLIHLQSAWHGRIQWKDWLADYTRKRYGKFAPEMQVYFRALVNAFKHLGRPQWECPEPVLANLMRNLRKAGRALLRAEEKGMRSRLLHLYRINLAYSLQTMQLYRQGYRAKHAFAGGNRTLAVRLLENAVSAMGEILLFSQKQRNSGCILFSSFNTTVFKGRKERYLKLIENIRSGETILTEEDFEKTINGGAW